MTNKNTVVDETVALAWKKSMKSIVDCKNDAKPIVLAWLSTLFRAWGGGVDFPSGFYCVIAKRRKIFSLYLATFTNYSLRTVYQYA